MTEISKVNIGKKDVFWNYMATAMQIGSGVLLYPLILNKFPSETLGIWSVFMTITGLTGILDFGFSPSFSRNITYIISGVNKLQKTGIHHILNSENDINPVLFSSTYNAMKWFYSRISMILFVLLSTVGTFYISTLLLKNQNTASGEIWISWVIFIITNVYQLLTMYYDALFSGMGKIKKAKQIIFTSQSLYISIAAILILLDFGLIAIVSSQFIALLIRRYLSYSFLRKDPIINQLQEVSKTQIKEIIKIILPNSMKLGITGLGAFLVLQSSVIIGSLYVDLKQLASYGISVQIVNVIASLSTVYYATMLPKITEWRVHNDLRKIKLAYYRTILITISIFVVAMLFLIIWGYDLFALIGSKTQLLPFGMLITIFLITFLEKNHAIAGGFLLMKNEVPFFRAAIISGIAVVILLLLMVDYWNLGLWGMILAPGIVQILYQNWKWPIELLKDLKQ